MKFYTLGAFGGFVCCLGTLFSSVEPAHAGRLINGTVPTAAREELPLGDAPAEQALRLAVGLSVRDPAALQTFVQQVSDPGSPNFRKYLTPEEFTERFAPTVEEYQSVINFVQAQGLTVTGLHPNRLLVDVAGSVGDVQRAFHVRIRNFRHPTEGRTFFAPENEPEVDAAVPISHIAGLTNYWIPRPLSQRRPLELSDAKVTPRTGSGPDGTLRGNDFRAAYLPGVTLTGAGQTVGLLEFDGYNPADISSYVVGAGLPSVPLQNVMVDGYSGHAGADNGEVCLDIQVAIAMAPGLSKIIVYEAPNGSPWEDILSQIANDNLAKQLSCSWGGGPPSSAAEQIFQQMAAQGQTFFNASGDDGAFVGSVPFPSDSPNIVEVGGTSLSTLTAGGAWVGESVWNWGGGTGSGGGISTYYTIPSWQQPVSMGTNQGSGIYRNVPDVAFTGDNIYTVSDNGQGSISGGTSCAAPLWAAFTALVNQQGAVSGQAPVGFINPALYTLGRGATYPVLFHDITSGNNINGHSAGRFSAVTGYDLCTGWGSPTTALITALLSPGTPIPTYTIDLTSNPSTGGTVTGAGPYLVGSTVNLTATPSLGFVFTNWTDSGNVVSTSSSFSFTANSNRSLVANFTQNVATYTVILSASPATMGAVSGGGTFVAGSKCIVAATPKRKHVFVSWTENDVVVSTNSFYVFTIDHNRNLVATFATRRGRNRRH